MFADIDIVNPLLSLEVLGKVDCKGVTVCLLVHQLTDVISMLLINLFLQVVLDAAYVVHGVSLSLLWRACDQVIVVIIVDCHLSSVIVADQCCGKAGRLQAAPQHS